MTPLRWTIKLAAMILISSGIGVDAPALSLGWHVVACVGAYVAMCWAFEA